MEHCLFRFSTTVLGVDRYTCPFNFTVTDHQMVRGGKPFGGCYAGTLFVMGLFCHHFELQDLGAELNTLIGK
jgi:hypothetical protein